MKKESLLDWLLMNHYDSAVTLFALENLVINPPLHGSRWIREAKEILDDYDKEKGNEKTF